MTDLYNMADDYSDSLDWDAPFAGIEYLNFFDGPDVLARNMILGKPRATVVGAPTHGEGYAAFTGLSNYLQTQVAETSALSIVSVWRSVGVVTGTPLSERAMVASNFLAGTLSGAGSSMLANINTRWQALTTANNSGAPGYYSAFGVVDPNTWGLRAMRVSAADGITADDMTAGLRQTVAMVYPRVMGARTIRIGSAYSTDYTGVVHQCVTALISRRITDNELTDLGDLMRYHAASRGIAV